MLLLIYLHYNYGNKLINAFNLIGGRLFSEGTRKYIENKFILKNFLGYACGAFLFAFRDLNLVYAAMNNEEEIYED